MKVKEEIKGENDGIDLQQLAVGPTGPLTSRPDRGPAQDEAGGPRRTTQ